MRIHSPREKWSSAYTANVSIGQGYVLVTPLQLAMVYATVANGGVSYFPRLVQQVVNADGTPVLNDKGEPIVPTTPKIHGDLRRDFKPEQIEQARKGLWKVVNEEGGTGGKARLQGVQVAGKTGTAQATDRGKSATVAWFACFAPYDHPKYAIAVMVEGGEHGGHGGSVAAPIATRILERTLAMDEGNFEPQVAWLAPAHKQNPFQTIASVDFKDAGPKLGGDDEEGADDKSAGDAQMANGGADPDVEPEADARGQVNQPRVARAVAVAPAPPARPRNFFERIFGRKQAQQPQQSQPTPTPGRRPRM
jgi:penicillin-binding protein 2